MRLPRAAPDNEVLKILNGDRKIGPVCSSPLVTVTLEQMEASGCYYPDAHRDPRQMSKLAGLACTLLGFKGIRVPFDLCVEAEAFGCRIKDADRESPPSIAGPAFEEDRELVIPEDIFKRGRLEAVTEAVMNLNIEFRGEEAIFAGITGPLTLIGQLYEVSQVMCWPIEDPQRLDRRLEVAADFLSEYANRLIRSGGSAVIISDPSASGDLISMRHFKSHALPAYQRMSNKIECPVILHICGNTNNFLDLVPLTGFEGYSFEGPVVQAKAARQVIGESMALVGNIPTYGLLLNGTPEMVMNESIKALSDGVDLLAPACGVPVHTPLENLKAMVRAVGRFTVAGEP